MKRRLRPLSKRPLSKRRIAVMASLWLHLAAVSALLSWTFSTSESNWQSRALTVGYAAAAKPEPAPANVVSDVADVTGELVRRRLNEVVDESKTKSDDAQRADLDRLARRLEQVSSEKGVDEVAAKLQGLLGTSSRASQPAAEAPAGDFDFDSAQLHDVRRETLADGQHRYWSMLLDSAGRTMEVEMSAEEGESLWKTFQRLKQFPLAEKVYRQIAMPLIDKLLNEAKADAKRAADGP